MQATQDLRAESLLSLYTPVSTDATRPYRLRTWANRAGLGIVQLKRPQWGQGRRGKQRRKAFTAPSAGAHFHRHSATATDTAKARSIGSR